ncbi:MAG: hypothetical protein JST22_16770 [Bacteroidetes bacterium]|nr:hypothetical protein [Bacteroidota bacterium]
MFDKSIERILKEAFPQELPYGFAERVAYNAMRAGGTVTIWDLLLRLSPRTSLAFGAMAAVLLVFGVAGSGPGVFDAVTNYSSYSSFLPLP